ncbi:MAG TPA: class I SAM-dependent methyltransferase [bacterium]|nr:class I SAM-dependent methyltransferase [bacterium]
MEVTGLDAKEFVSWSKLARNVHFIQQDLIQLSEENHYDFSLCIDVLEHIPGNKLVLEKIYRSLEPGGYFCRHMPDDKYSRRIFSKKFFKEFEKWVEDEHIGPQYTFKEMKNVFRSTEFAIIQAHNTFGY